MKTCTKCKHSFDLALFNKDKGTKDGLHKYCRECSRAHGRAMYIKHKNNILVAVKQYADKNKEVKKLYLSEYAKENRDALLAYRREWHRNNPNYSKNQYINNPHPYKIKTQYRKAKRLQATPPWFGELDEFAFDEAYRLTEIREQYFGFKWEVDHVVPLISTQVSGLHVASNIAVVPRIVNRAKGNRHWPDMA